MLPLQRTVAPSVLRAARTASLRPTPASFAAASSRQVQQSRQAHAISNPTLANIEKRWDAMPPQEQADLWMALRDRMTVDWNELTLQEKKAAYWIAFGPHGPRAETPPGENMKIFAYTMVAVGASAVLFGIVRYFARPPPHTMTKEYQEATGEYMKENKIEPISLFTEGYQGKGMVQSAPKGDRKFTGEPED